MTQLVEQEQSNLRKLWEIKLSRVASQYPLELWQFLDHFDDFQFGVTSDIHLGLKAKLENHIRDQTDTK